MAFRLPQAPAQRQQAPSRTINTRPASLQQPLDHSQEWVLFSPAHTQTLSQTGESPRTAGVSRLSDFGSINSIAPPSHEVDDGDELDSLDDGLHEFREPLTAHAGRQLDHSGGAILPQHDGMGSFQASTHPVQEHLWQHERHNPQRRPSFQHHRLSSTHKRPEGIGNTPEEEHQLMAGEKLDMIETWRLEQSKIMLEEVEKEAWRRRCLSTTSQSQVQAIPATNNAAAASIKSRPEIARAATKPSQESESFWQRVTRRVIKDFMGIDEPLLSVILGESLPEQSTLSSTPKSFDSTNLTRHLEGVEEEHLVIGWEDRLLKRLARELNIIVNQLSDRGSSFESLQSETLEYAGIPIKIRKHPPIPEQDELDLGTTPKALGNSLALFAPTLHPTVETETTASDHEAGWGIEDRQSPENGHPIDFAGTDYWERTPDLKQVFAYLSRRFINPNPHQAPASLSDMSYMASSRPGIATSSSPEMLRRAAIIRQHHPLVSCTHEARQAKQRRTAHQRRLSLRSIAERIEVPMVALSECDRETISGSLRSLKRMGDGCASQSTKRSKTSRSRRHYWDVGSDSAAATCGGMGAWGEV